MTVKRSFDSVVFAPPLVYGGVKSLYSVCEWLGDFGRSTIAPFAEPKLADWFAHKCRLYDHSYSPDVVIYPEVYQPAIEGNAFRICFALGQLGPIEPRTDLAVCRSPEVLDWVKRQHPSMSTRLVLPSINRSVFEYDNRPKQNLICYMTRPHKYPETATLLRKKYGDQVVEIVNFSEAEVAETLKNAKVFVWRGADTEGSPRPPKEALVAGCVVVGLKSDLNEKYHTNFGIRCSTVRKLIRMAGKALKMSVPSPEARAVIRDSEAEKKDWFALFDALGLNGREQKTVL